MGNVCLGYENHLKSPSYPPLPASPPNIFPGTVCQRHFNRTGKQNTPVDLKLFTQRCYYISACLGSVFDFLTLLQNDTWRILPFNHFLRCVYVYRYMHPHLYTICIKYPAKIAQHLSKTTAKAVILYKSTNI